MTIYSAQVVEHFDAPRNAGRLATAPDVVEAEAGSRSQGTQFHFSARIAGNALAAVHFEAYGCPHCIAAASWLTQRLRGASVDALERWSWREVAEALAVPAEKRGHLLTLEDAVRRLAAAWRRHG
ncbi:MAG TPA: iron-sulfur cluster assembly scaffold protein [Povalibacter sp.]|uniref:iron-sulfur cluster assembly scaffold protein n=1 Tax=Povalibacter sp. TaxID=1962978 RepID=UPI002D121A31|nr:iron-sulfur cluster assembly scaffold protein [Povalibacter sp.]HMN43203.1 iron-sulfur cluster assembly scaffold protein [Povalibacter sp.]